MNADIERGFVAVIQAAMPDHEIREATSSKSLRGDAHLVIVECPESEHTWVSRHGSGSGQCRVEVGGPDMRIVITNSVTFVNRADDLERRVAFALYKRTRAILRQLEYFQQQSARRAGL